MAGVQTGSSNWAASDPGGRAEMPGCCTAATWKRAVPALMVSAGKRTSTRSSAGTVTRWPSSETAEPETFEVSQTSKVWQSAIFAPRTTTSTVMAVSVWFWSTTGSSNRSPKFRKRGGEGRTISGRRAVIVDSPLPNSFPPATATAITR